MPDDPTDIRSSMTTESTATAATVHGCPRCDCQQVQDNGSVSDGFGSTWAKCERGVNCGLEIVRPGKVQCWCDDGSTEPPSDESDQGVYDRVMEGLAAS